MLLHSTEFQTETLSGKITIGVQEFLFENQTKDPINQNLGEKLPNFNATLSFKDVP